MAATWQSRLIAAPFRPTSSWSGVFSRLSHRPKAQEAPEGYRILIEQAMYFALGFLTAGLFALMLLPAFWRRAMCLSMRRLQMLSPLSMEEVAAERDLLRAEFAARYRRLEQQTAAVKAARAKDLAEIGRQVARIADLETQLTAANARAHDLETQLHHMQKIVDKRTGLSRSTETAPRETAESVELGRQTEKRQTRVAGHETKIAGLHIKNAELRRHLEQLRRNFARLGTEGEPLTSVDAALPGTTQEAGAAPAEKLRLQRALEDARARLLALENSYENHIEHLESALRVAHAEERDRADRLENARSDNAMLQGAIEALRKEHTLIREAHVASPQLPPPPVVFAPAGLAAEAPGDRDVLALRQAIVDIGARMAEIATSASQDRDPSPAKRAGERAV